MTALQIIVWRLSKICLKITEEKYILKLSILTQIVGIA